MRRNVCKAFLFALSGLAATILAGAVATLLIGFLMDGFGGILLGVVLAWAGAIVAVQWAAVPAIVLGGVLWMLGATRPRLRQWWLWCAIGAAMGAAFLLYPGQQAVESLLSIDDVPFHSRWLSIIFILAGAIGGFAFRSTMRFGELFIPEELEG